MYIPTTFQRGYLDPLQVKNPQSKKKEKKKSCRRLERWVTAMLCRISGLQWKLHLLQLIRSSWWFCFVLFCFNFLLKYNILQLLTQIVSTMIFFFHKLNTYVANTWKRPLCFPFATFPFFIPNGLRWDVLLFTLCIWLLSALYLCCSSISLRVFEACLLSFAVEYSAEWVTPLLGAFGQFPFGGCYERRCSDYSNACLSVDLCTRFCWIHT